MEDSISRPSLWIPAAVEEPGVYDRRCPVARAWRWRECGNLPSLINAVLLRPLPITDPAKVLSVEVLGKNDSIDAFSYVNYLDFRDRNEVLSGLLVHRFAPMSLSREETTAGLGLRGNRQLF